MLREMLENTRYFGDNQHNVLFYTPTFGHVPFPLITLALLLISFFVHFRNPKAFSKHVLLFLAIAVFFQTISQAIFVVEMMETFYKKNAAARKEIVVGEPMALIQCIQAHAQGMRLSGGLVTGVGTSSLVPKNFQYELYPSVNLITPTSQPQVRICYKSPECAKTFSHERHIMCLTDSGYAAWSSNGQ